MHAARAHVARFVVAAWAAVAATGSTAGCDAYASLQCVAGHPIDDDSSVVDDNGGTLQDANAQCEASRGDQCEDGACRPGDASLSCDTTSVITRDAAVCVAHTRATPLAGRGEFASLVFSLAERKIVWVVEVTVEEQSPSTFTGVAVTMDAATGLVIDESAFSAVFD